MRTSISFSVLSVSSVVYPQVCSSKTKIAESTIGKRPKRANFQSKSQCIANFPKEKDAVVKKSGTAIKGVSFELIFS